MFSIYFCDVARRSIYTKALGEIIAKTAMDIYPLTYDVISSYPNKWAVLRSDKSRASRRFSTLRAAKSYAKRAAISNSAKEVFIHSKDGSVTEVIVLN